MKQIQYQQKAVRELTDKTIDLLTYSGMRHTLVFKAPTGAGKTVMASEMLLRLNAELRDRTDVPCKEVAYIWIAPNKLHEQSYFKMRSFFTEGQELHPVIYDDLDHSAEGYIHPGEILFVNWESINKDNAAMIRDTEQGPRSSTSLAAPKKSKTYLSSSSSTRNTCLPANSPTRQRRY